MNAGTQRGSALGFRLDALLRLPDIKAADRKTSLLQVRRRFRSGRRMGGVTTHHLRLVLCSSRQTSRLPIAIGCCCAVFVLSRFGASGPSFVRSPQDFVTGRLAWERGWAYCRAHCLNCCCCWIPCLCPSGASYCASVVCQYSGLWANSCAPFYAEHLLKQYAVKCQTPQYVVARALPASPTLAQLPQQLACVRIGAGVQVRRILGSTETRTQ